PKSVQQAGNEEWQHDQAAASFIKNNRGRAADDLANLNTWIYEDHGCDREYVNCPLNFVNPKGWVDCWRVPKYMYYLWQAWYSPKPMVYIHPYVWSSGYLGQKKEIVVDSNCKTVELKVNGRSVGILKPSLAEANVVRFENVPIERGVLTAIGTRSNQTVTNSVIMAGPSARLTLSTDPKTFEAGLDSVAVIRADITDAQGNQVYGATNTIYWSVSGPATLVGAPVYQTDIAKDQASDGTMYICAPTLNIIRSSGKPGEITVRVQSPGLASAEISIMATAPPKNAGDAIIQPPLPQTERKPVAHENGASENQEVVVQEMKDISEDLLLKGSDLADYSNQIDNFLRAKNPEIDFDSPEYRAVVSVFARLLQHNHGSLVRDDFDFIAGLYNNCRQITRQIDALKIPARFKKSLREFYARAMIVQGEAKDFATETRWLKSLPDGKLVIVGRASSPSNGQDARSTNVIYTDNDGFEKMVALALPEIKNESAPEKPKILNAVWSLNPNVRRTVTTSGGEKIGGVRQKKIETVTYNVAKGRPILVPDMNYLAEVIRNSRKEKQN
ncbi:MAG: DUF4982 domain-containing protein, partial [Limisphaerales bacterium]